MYAGIHGHSSLIWDCQAWAGSTERTREVGNFQSLLPFTRERTLHRGMEQDQGQALPPGVTPAQYGTPDMQPQAMPVQEGPFALGLAAEAGRASNIAWTTIPPMHPLSGPLVQMFKVCSPPYVPIQPRYTAFHRSPEPGLWAVAQPCPSGPLLK